jgi:hypothetical protein
MLSVRPGPGTILLACGVASSILYVVVDVIASLRYDGYHYADQEVSELLATGAPSRNLMLVLNVIPYNLLVISFAGGIWIMFKHRRAGRLTAILLTAYALTGAAGGGIFNMDRREVIAAGDASWRSVMHIPATIVMSLFVMGAMVAASRLLDARFRYYSYGTIATLLIFGALTSTQAGQMESDKPTPWMGIEERVNIYALMLWVAVLSVALMREHRASAPGMVNWPKVPAQRHVPQSR